MRWGYAGSSICHGPTGFGIAGNLFGVLSIFRWPGLVYRSAVLARFFWACGFAHRRFAYVILSLNRVLLFRNIRARCYPTSHPDRRGVAFMLWLITKGPAKPPAPGCHSPLVPAAYIMPE